MGQSGTCVGQSGSRVGLPGSRVGLPGTRVGLPGSRMGRQGQETCSTRATSRYEPPRQTFSGPRPKVEKISFSGCDVRAPFAEARLLHVFFFLKIKLKRERHRDTTRLRLTWESLDSQPASLRLNSPKFCGRGKRAGLGSAAAVLPRNSSPTEALDPSFHARALISSPKP